ncbi:hypothetical protein PgNI_05149, partial [Pyricularia grisea]|uniref:Uncharacterized protein n=1 Tax=Pyricularia grisea TaxID=148305 RepID=A0A6P8B698_PYRGI
WSIRVRTLIFGAAGTATFSKPLYYEIIKRLYKFWSIGVRTLIFRAVYTVTFFKSLY